MGESCAIYRLSQYSNFFKKLEKRKINRSQKLNPEVARKKSASRILELWRGL